MAGFRDAVFGTGDDGDSQRELSRLLGDEGDLGELRRGARTGVHMLRGPDVPRGRPHARKLPKQ